MNLTFQATVKWLDIAGIMQHVHSITWNHCYNTLLE